MTNPNSHVTTRRLTKPWEVGQRMLHYYDFAKDVFGEQSSKSLLTADESFGHDVERFLNTTIENDLANHLNALNAGSFERSLPWRHERALLLSVFLQPLRVRAGRGEQEAKDELRLLLAKDDAFFDQLSVASRRDFRRIGIKLPLGQVLYFPSNGLQTFPLIGASRTAPGMLIQPTGLDTLFACVPNDVPENVVDDQVRDAMAGGFFMAFSVGLQCDKVIIPPAFVGRDDASRREAILTLREVAQRFTQTIAEANRIVGF